MLGDRLRRQEDLARWRVGEEQHHILVQARLIGFDGEEVIRAGCPQLATERLLTIQGIAAH